MVCRENSHTKPKIENLNVYPKIKAKGTKLTFQNESQCESLKLKCHAELGKVTHQAQKWNLECQVKNQSEKGPS